MKKTIKVLIGKAEAIVRIWKEWDTDDRAAEMRKAVQELEEAIRQVKGEV